MSILHFKPPYWEDSSEIKGLSIFLGGSIEMGKAVDWQQDIVDTFSDYNITVFNPRRDNWDSSWEQSIHNLNFKDQVTWEIKHIEKCDIVIFYIQGNTLSPITLLEIGLCCGRNNVIICCEKEFWRKGNVEVVADIYGMTLVETMDDLKSQIKLKLDK